MILHLILHKIQVHKTWVLCYVQTGFDGDEIMSISKGCAFVLKLIQKKEEITSQLKKVV